MTKGNLRWVIVSLVALATIINYIDRGALAVLWPEISAELGLTKTDYAIIINVFTFAYAFGQSLFGKIFDWIGTRLGFVLAIGVWSVATMLHAVAALPADVFNLPRPSWRVRSRQLARCDQGECGMVSDQGARARARHLQFRRSHRRHYLGPDRRPAFYLVWQLASHVHHDWRARPALARAMAGRLQVRTRDPSLA